MRSGKHSTLDGCRDERWEQRPVYWDQAAGELTECDRILRKIIPSYPRESFVAQCRPFATLARIVLGQHVSRALARTLWARLLQACGPAPTADCVAGLGDEVLRGLGLSRRKAQYMQDLADYFVTHGDDAQRWHVLSDQDVIAELCTIRGVGRWSADLFLIFNMGRPDVLPLDDPGLIRAISHHYFSGEPVSRFEAREVAQAWAPYRTVASWYLWRSLDAGAFDY